MSVSIDSHIAPATQRASGSSASAPIAPIAPIALRPAAPVPVAVRRRRQAPVTGHGSNRTSRPYRVTACPVRVRVVVADAHSSAVQLTRTGWAALLTAAAVLAVGLLWAGHLSLPKAERTAASAAAASAPRSPAPGSVIVRPGDTLWSIAAAVAPTRDPRQVVFDLRQRNQLGSAVLVPGQVLRLPG